MNDRLYCPLAPCLRRQAEGGIVTDETVRQSRSFATLEAYLRHVDTGHFISPVNAPAPYKLVRPGEPDERD